MPWVASDSSTVWLPVEPEAPLVMLMKVGFRRVASTTAKASSRG